MFSNLRLILVLTSLVSGAPCWMAAALDEEEFMRLGMESVKSGEDLISLITNPLVHKVTLEKIPEQYLEKKSIQVGVESVNTRTGVINCIFVNNSNEQIYIEVLSPNVICCKVVNEIIVYNLDDIPHASPYTFCEISPDKAMRFQVNLRDYKLENPIIYVGVDYYPSPLELGALSKKSWSNATATVPPSKKAN